MERCHVLDFEFFPEEPGSNEFAFEVEKVFLSPRGEFLMRGNHQHNRSFIDSFTYLQVLVDDYILPIPSSVFKEFVFRTPDYGYLASPDYAKDLLLMLSKKCRQTYIFLDILRCSLFYEQKFFSGAFNNLNEEKIMIPDIDNIEKMMIEDIMTIQNSISFGSNQFDYENHLPNEAQRKRYRSDLEEEFRALYSMPHDCDRKWN